MSYKGSAPSSESGSRTPNLADTNVLKRCCLFWGNALRRFVSKSGFIHASALSYTSLVGMIPVLAVGLSVATSLMVKEGDEGQEQVQGWIESMIQTVAPMLDLEVREGGSTDVPLPPDTNESSDNQDSSEASIDVTGNLVENYLKEARPFEGGKLSLHGGQRKEVARQIAAYMERIHKKTIGVTSVCVFLVVAIMLLRAIERTFNQVWEIPKNRSWGAGVAQYWAGLTLGPFLFVLGTTISTSKVLFQLTEYFQNYGSFGTLFLFFLSWGFTGAACALVYRIMTNTRMTFKAAVCGGLTAGFFLQLNNQLPVVYISNVATTNKIYGSLGAVPILLLGLYVSWIILIFGSHVAFMVQHPNQVNDDEDSSAGDSVEHSLLTAVRVMQLIASRFQSGEKPYTPEDLADCLQLDHASVHDSVGLLADSGLVFRGEESCGGLSLGKPAEAITLKDIFQVVDKDLNGQAKLGAGDACFEIYHKIIRDRDESAASVKLSDLV